jgi:hypothetical protein
MASIAFALRSVSSARGAPIPGPMTLLNALRANDVWPDDARDILRLGLVGGGMEPAEAHRLLKHYFDDFERYPLLSNMRPAFMVLLAGLTGPPQEADLKKKKKPRKTPRSSSTGSTAPVLP